LRRRTEKDYRVYPMKKEKTTDVHGKGESIKKGEVFREEGKPITRHIKVSPSN